MKRNKSVLGSVNCVARLAFVGSLLLAFHLTFSAQAIAQGGTWTTKAPMPTTRAFLSTSVVNGVIYAIGGWNFGSFGTVEAYDPATNTWTTKASMPTARDLLSTSVVNGVIYAVGGENGNAMGTVEAYDPATDTWTTKASMPTARSTFSTSVVNGILYAVGGQNQATYFNTVEAYDPATNTWTTKAPMPTTRYALSTSVVDGIIYAVGGGDKCPNYCTAADYLGTVEAYDPTTDTWTTKASMPTGRLFLSASAVNGLIYAVGGDYIEISLGTVEVYDPAADTWTTATPMPTPRSGFGTSVVNGVLYAVGGALTSIVEAFTPTNQSPDSDPPKIACGAPDGLWHATDVLVSCTASDTGSGLANPADGSFALATSVSTGTETANASTTSHQVCDVAGNCATGGPVSGNRVDKKSPVISITAPANGSYLLNQPAASSYSCSDGGSGVHSCAGPVAAGANFDTASVGGKMFAVNASDNVSNSSSSSTNYSVVYPSSGLCLGEAGHQILQPINADGSSVFKRNSTVPAKFRVCDANGSSVSTAGMVSGFNLVQVISGTVVSNVNEQVDSTTPDSAFRWDSAAQQWIFNISTRSLSVSKTYVYLITLNDGSTISFQFGLK